MSSKYILFSLYFVGTMANAVGGVDGGGGKSVVCRDSQGKIISAELLDLYEGRVQYSLAPKVSSDSIERQIDDVVERLSAGRDYNFRTTLMKHTRFVSEAKVILPEGTGLLPVDDAYNVIVPKNCQIEQLANFTNQNQILVNGEIYNSLNDTNKAALIVHEALYKIFRIYGSTNSIRARKSVALGFSTIDLNGNPNCEREGNCERVVENVIADLPSKYLDCHTLPNSNGSPFPGSHFYAFNDENGELVFQFDYLDGELMLTKSKVYVDKIPVEELLQIIPTKKVIYWSSMLSIYDMFLGVAVSFESTVQSGIPTNIRKIGIGNQPQMPSAVFSCSK
jgi:hypothetical protein